MKGSKDGDSGENGEATGNGSGEEEEEDMDTGGDDTTSSSANGASSRPAKRKKAAIRESSRSATAAVVDSDEPDSRPPPSKRRKKTVCKYGAKCYQTGTRHREQFDHPWDVGGVHKLECANIKVEDVSELDGYSLVVL